MIKVKTLTTAGKIVFTATHKHVRVSCRGRVAFKILPSGKKFTSTQNGVFVSALTPEACYKKALRSFWSV